MDHFHCFFRKFFLIIVNLYQVLKVIYMKYIGSVSPMEKKLALFDVKFWEKNQENGENSSIFVGPLQGSSLFFLVFCNVISASRRFF